MSKPELSASLQLVYDYVGRYIETYGAAPSVRQIGQKFGWYGTARAQDALRLLEEKGLLRRSAVQLNNTKLTGQADTTWKRLDKTWPSPGNESGQVQFASKTTPLVGVILTWNFGALANPYSRDETLYNIKDLTDVGYTHWRYVTKAEWLP